MMATTLAPLVLWTLLTYRPCTAARTTTVALPKVITPFEEITTSPTFVDKTLFIKLIFKKELTYDGYYIMTCPRGFGKTIIMDMVKKFVQLPTDQKHQPVAESKKRQTDSYKLFTDPKLKLAISRHRPIINEHHGKYATIYFDFDIAACTTYSEIFDQVRQKIGQLYEQHRWLYEEKYAQAVDNSHVKALFERFFSGNVTETDIRDSLRELAIILNRKYNAPVFVFIDNYDTPIATAIRNGAATIKVHGLISDMMRNLLNDTSEIVPYFLLTGVSSTFASYMAAGCREMKALSFLYRSRFGKYFGFTDDDMAKLYEKFNIQPAERIAIYEHYGGYRTEQGIVHTHDETEQECFSVYNPFSVSAYFKERPEGDLQTYNFHTYWTDKDKDDATILTNVHLLRNVFLRDHIDEIVLANRAPFLAHMISPGKDLRNLEKMFVSTRTCEGYKGLSYMLYLYDMGYLTNYVKNYLQPPNLEVKQRFRNYLRAYITQILNITETKLESIATSVRGIVENPITTDQMRTELANSLRHEDILAFAFERDHKRYSYLYKKNDLCALLYIAIDTHSRQHFANVSTNVILQQISERNLYKLVQIVPTADFLITSKDEQCVSCLQITDDGNTTGIVEPLKNYTRFMFAKQPKYLKYLTINMQNRTIQVDSCPTMQMVEEQWLVL